MKTQLARPEASPEPRPLRVELRETHISFVFLADADVFKVKKPLNLGFLDFRTLEKAQGCGRETS